MQRKMEKTQSHTHKHKHTFVGCHRCTSCLVHVVQTPNLDVHSLLAWYMYVQTLRCTCLLAWYMWCKPWDGVLCAWDKWSKPQGGACLACLIHVCPNLEEVRVLLACLLAWYMCVPNLELQFLACLIHVVQTLRFWLAWDNGGLNLEVGQGRRKSN